MTPDVTKPLRDVVADRLRQQIIRGDLRPGQRVREDELASMHGVSRVPAREAVQQLANEGFLELVPYRGAVVATLSHSRTLEVMQIRRALEAMAARLAAERRGEPVAKELARIVQRGSRAAASQTHAGHSDLVNQFHQLVATASGNTELEELVARMRGKIRWMFSVDVHERSADSWADHTCILQAILDGDGDTAAQLMDTHVSKDELVYRDKLGSD